MTDEVFDSSRSLSDRIKGVRFISQSVPIGFASPDMWDGALSERTDAYDEWEKYLNNLTTARHDTDAVPPPPGFNIWCAQHVIGHIHMAVWERWLTQRHPGKRFYLDFTGRPFFGEGDESDE